MDLNKRAMEHLGREQLYGYGIIDESSWQEEALIAKEKLKTGPPGSRETSPILTHRTGTGG